MRRHHDHVSGFTLVELLVAISILAIVAVLGWRGLDGIVRARVSLTEQLEATRGMQLAFAQMQSDAEHMVNPKLLDGRPYLVGAANRITLVRNMYRENEPSRLQVIAYRVVNGVLIRRESVGTRDLIALDIMWRAATSDADTSAAVALQSGVINMQVQTWERNGWREGGQAREPSALNLAPTGLQVALQVQGAQLPLSKAFLLGGM